MWPSQTSLAALASAREKGDFEAATRNIQRAMAVDKAISGSAFAEAVVVSALSTITRYRYRGFDLMSDTCPHSLPASSPYRRCKR